MEAGRLLQWSRWEDDSSDIGDGEEGRNMKECKNTGNIWIFGEKFF